MTREWRLKVLGLGVQQARLIRRGRAFLRSEERRGVDVAISPECYLNGWARVLGNARLRFLARQSGSAFKLFVDRLREAMLVAGQSGYEVVAGTKQGEPLNRLVVSWSRGSDFAPDGSYRDRYFRTGSRENPSTLWFLISIDDSVPGQLDPNVAVMRRRPGTPRLDVLFLLQSAASALGRRPRDTGSAPLLSATVSFADQVTQIVIERFRADSFESVVMPYEGQPFQHVVFRAVKRENPATRTIGYLHSALPPLPTDLIHRRGAPELLLVHGQGQADILSRHLKWPPHALRVIASLRYRAADSASLHGFVFLPYYFDAPRTIEAAFREFVLSAATGSLPNLTVRNHPVMDRSGIHINLKNNLQGIIRAFPGRFASTASVPRLSVFIGATAAILEALERGVAVIHICSQPLLESHCEEIWEHLSVERLGEHVFRYRLQALGAYIKFGGEGASMASYCDDFSMRLGQNES
jgi:hypothetical protein